MTERSRDEPSSTSNRGPRRRRAGRPIPAPTTPPEEHTMTTKTKLTDRQLAALREIIDGPCY